VKTLLEMSVEHHRELLAKCAALNREYAVLKNGIVIPSANSDGAPPNVAIVCEPVQAKHILDLVSQLYPEAAPHIQEFYSRDPND
jgi:hypothetical protein